MSGDCSTVNDLYRASSNGPKFSYYSFILRAFQLPSEINVN